MQEGLHKEVHRIDVCQAVLKIDGVSSNALMNEVMVNVDVL